jgi:hypothetical protein
MNPGWAASSVGRYCGSDWVIHVFEWWEIEVVCGAEFIVDE